MDLKPIRELVDILKNRANNYRDLLKTAASGDFKAGYDNGYNLGSAHRIEEIIKLIEKALADCHPRIIGQLPEEVAIERIRAGEDVDAVLEDYGWKREGADCQGQGEGDFKLLRDQVEWAVGHFGTVKTEGIFEHLSATLKKIDTGLWPHPPQTQSQEGGE